MGDEMAAKFRNLDNLGLLVYNGYEYTKRRHPKAAKKKRIQNKWRNRFGLGWTGFHEPDVNLLLEAVDSFYGNSK